MDSPTVRKHILLVTIPAYGHIIPLLELGKKISHHHQVTFVVSENKLEEIKKRDLLVGVNFPVVPIMDGYIEEPEVLSRLIFIGIASHVLPAAQKFFRAMPVRSNHVEDAIPNPASLGIVTPVDVVIGDILLAEALAILHPRNVPFYFFDSGTSGMTLAAFSLEEDSPTVPNEFFEKDKDFPIMEIPPPGSAPPPVPAVIKTLFFPVHQVTPLATGVVANSVQDIDASLINIIKSRPKMNCTFRCVGPLVSDEKELETELQKKVKIWLDEKQKESVIYIAFGSIAIPTPDYTREILKALLAIKKPFIWALPERAQSHLPEEFFTKISTQFEVPKMPNLVLDWAPQKLILQHPSTAVFLSHCGWNSALESLVGGVPVVAWPMFAEQKLNAQQLVQLGTALVMQDTGTGWKKIILAEDIRKAILVTAGFSGESNYRKAVLKWKEKLRAAIAPNGSSEKNFKELMDFKDKTD